MYELVRLAAIDLDRRVVHLVEESENGRRLVMRPLAVRVDKPADAFPQGDANSYVVLKFNDELKPELLQLSKHYTQYIGEWTTLLKTSYAIAQIVEKMDILFDYEPVYDSSGPHLNKPGISGIRFFNIRLKTEGR